MTQFWQFLSEGYLPLIRKDSVTHMHGPAVYVNEERLFARELSLENSDSYLFSTGFTSFIVLFLYLCAWFLLLFHLPMYLPLETSTFFIRTG